MLQAVVLASRTGKIHLLIALRTAGRGKASGVRYTPATKLINELIEAPTNASWRLQSTSQSRSLLQCSAKERARSGVSLEGRRPL